MDLGLWDDFVLMMNFTIKPVVLWCIRYWDMLCDENIYMLISLLQKKAAEYMEKLRGSVIRYMTV